MGGFRRVYMGGLGVWVGLFMLTEMVTWYSNV